jgi:hypothetical protein
MNISELFPRTVFHLGTITHKSGPHNVEWPTTITAKELSSIKPDCGCSANLRLEKGKIVGTYTDQSNAPREGMKVSKFITVNLNDGLPDFIKNEKGIQVPNPSKVSKVRLEIRAFVVSP